MRLTIILKEEDYRLLLDDNCDFLSDDIYLSGRRSVKEMNDLGSVNRDEMALQITVDKVYEPETKTKLVEVKDD